MVFDVGVWLVSISIKVVFFDLLVLMIVRCLLVWMLRLIFCSVFWLVWG